MGSSLQRGMIRSGDKAKDAARIVGNFEISMATEGR
jgi:hypothetical protein